MKKIALLTLIAVNAVLALSLVSRMTRENKAVAQAGGGASARDDFLMVPGEINGGNNAIVYVIDETTRQLSSMSYDDSNRKLATSLPRSMDRDFDENQQAGNGGRRGR